MPDRSGRREIGQIGLVEQVGAGRRVVVRGHRELRLVGRDRARHVVLIGAVVARHRAVVANGQGARLMFNGDVCQVDVGVHMAVRGIAEIGGRIDHDRLALRRGDAAIGDPRVVEIFVAGDDLGAAVRHERQGRGDAVTLQADGVPKAVGVLEHAVNPERRGLAELVIQIGRDPLVAIHPALHGHFVQRLEQRLLADAVDHAAGPAAAEHQRVRSLENLDPVQIVQIAVVLHVVANAVDEEVG